MQLKTRAQIIGAASVKLAVIFRNQDINIMHTIISQAAVRSYRCPRSQQLAPNDIPCPAGRQTLNQINQIQSKLLRPNLKLSPCHKFSFSDFNFPPSAFIQFPLFYFFRLCAFLKFSLSSFPQFPLFPSFFEVFIFVHRCKFLHSDSV